MSPATPAKNGAPARPWRLPGSVRARLAVWFGIGLLVVVSVYAVAVLAQVRDDLLETLDSQLAGDFALAVEWMGRAQGPAMSSGTWIATGSVPGEEVGDTPWLDAWSLDGRRLLTAGRPPDLPTPVVPPAGRPVGAATVRVPGGGTVRVLAGRAVTAGRIVILRVGRSDAAMREELWEFVTALLLSLPVAFAAAVGAGYLLARRALAPVAAMTARARQITADHLEDRLPVVNPGDEFGQLAIVINAALARLEQSFDTLRRFTADASHELRTPLTTIRSVGEVGLRGRREEREYREIVGSILEETDRLTTLVDNLLTLSRADAGRSLLEPSVFPLAGLAGDVVDVLGVLAEEKRQRITVEADTEAAVRADRATVRQAAMNLIDNAIKHSPDGTSIRVVVKETQSGAVLEVIDEGPGIPREHLPRVFDRFYRVDQGRSRAAGGAGLGLSIARWAVEANGGRIEMESEEGGGSTFRIVLPAAP